MGSSGQCILTKIPLSILVKIAKDAADKLLILTKLLLRVKICHFGNFFGVPKLTILNSGSRRTRPQQKSAIFCRFALENGVNCVCVFLTKKSLFKRLKPYIYERKWQNAILPPFGAISRSRNDPNHPRYWAGLFFARFLKRVPVYAAAATNWQFGGDLFGQNHHQHAYTQTETANGVAYTFVKKNVILKAKMASFGYQTRTKNRSF